MVDIDLSEGWATFSFCGGDRAERVVSGHEQPRCFRVHLGPIGVFTLHPGKGKFSTQKERFIIEQQCYSTRECSGPQGSLAMCDRSER